MANDGNLTPTQRRAIAALLAERDTRAAAAAARVGYRTLCRWLTEPAFRAELRACEARAIDGAVLRLAELTAEAVATLRAVMLDPDAAAGNKVQAANIALARLLDLRAAGELEARLAAVEARLGIPG